MLLIDLKFKVGDEIIINKNRPHGAELFTGDVCIIFTIEGDNIKHYPYYGVKKIGDFQRWWVSDDDCSPNYKYEFNKKLSSLLDSDDKEPLGDM